MRLFSVSYFRYQVLDRAAARYVSIYGDDAVLAVREQVASVGAMTRAHSFQSVGAAIPLDVFGLDALSFRLDEFDHYEISFCLKGAIEEEFLRERFHKFGPAAEHTGALRRRRI